MGSKGLWEKMASFLSWNGQFLDTFVKIFTQILPPPQQTFSNISHFWPKNSIFQFFFSKNLLECLWPNTFWKFGIRTTKTRKIISFAGLWSENRHHLSFGSPSFSKGLTSSIKKFRLLDSKWKFEDLGQNYPKQGFLQTVSQIWPENDQTCQFFQGFDISSGLSIRNGTLKILGKKCPNQAFRQTVSQPWPENGQPGQFFQGFDISSQTIWTLDSKWKLEDLGKKVSKPRFLSNSVSALTRKQPTWPIFPGV